MLNRKFFLSLVLIVAGVSFLGAAHGTKWDGDWGPGSMEIEDLPRSEMARINTIGLKQALTLAESETGGKALGVHLRKMHGYLIYVADIVTPGNTEVKVVVDAGDGRILFLEGRKASEKNKWEG